MKQLFLTISFLSLALAPFAQTIPDFRIFCPQLDELILSAEQKFTTLKTTEAATIPEKFTGPAFKSKICPEGFSTCWFAEDYGVSGFKLTALFTETTNMKEAEMAYRQLSEIMDQCKPPTGVMGTDEMKNSSLITKIWLPINYDGKLRPPLTDLVIELNFSKLPTINQ